MVDLSFLNSLGPVFTALGDSAVYISIGVNVLQGFIMMMILSHPTIGSLVDAWLSKRTWLQYERVNGAIKPMVVTLEDGCYDDPKEGIFVSTPGSTKMLPGGIRTTTAYEGLASTIPTKFANAAQKADDMGIDNIEELMLVEKESLKTPENEDENKVVEKARKVLNTIDFSVIRNFFMYDFTPRGMRAMINRKVAIELQNEKDGGWGAFLGRPEVLIGLGIIIMLIATVAYPAVSNQQMVQQCQQKLTSCLAAQVSGASVG